jgi:hypothetical protein
MIKDPENSLPITISNPKHHTLEWLQPIHQKDLPITHKLKCHMKALNERTTRTTETESYMVVFLNRSREFPSRLTTHPSQKGLPSHKLVSVSKFRHINYLTQSQSFGQNSENVYKSKI